MKMHIKNTLISTVAVFAIAFSVNVGAEDTEVFYSENVSKPNVLFILDISGSMRANVPGTGKNRMEIMQSAFSGMMAAAPDNVKIGLMNYGERGIQGFQVPLPAERFRQHSVSGVGFPATDINALAKEITDVSGTGNALTPNVGETIREYLPRVVNSWSEKAWTPIVDSLYEAALYFRGEEMHFGLSSPATSGAHPATYSGPEITVDVRNVGRDSIRSTTTNANGATVPQYQYKSPIESSCQENYIVLMTDGGPTYVTNDGEEASYTTGPFNRVMRGDSSYSALAGAIPNCVNPPSGKWVGRCGAEITSYIATNDNMPDPSETVPNGQEGDQLVKTYVVGFGSGLKDSAKNYLKSLETIDDDPETTKVEDGYFEADNPQDLIDTFTNILSDIAEPKGTLASPGYSVNVKNGLEHEKDIYIPVFDRKNASRWSGNLKKFLIEDVGGRRLIRGKNGLNAVDELGGFSSEALDYWSESPNSDPDGKNVQRGGVASLLENPDQRNIYSNLTGDSNVNLSSAGNKLHIDNIANINNAVLGIASGNVNYRKKLIQFMRGWKLGDYDSGGNPKGIARKHMGDMLHSEPLVITYSAAGGAGGKKQYIFAATNEGYLHAFDTTTGEEKFAFIPAELLRTIVEPQFRNEGTQSDHKYGIDGTLTYWQKDGRTIVYFGMRRGGTSFYALDVSNINNPILLWKKSSSDYPSMGQSWSPPYLAKVTDSDGAPREVVIISGGYDIDEDRDVAGDPGVLSSSTTTVTASEGNDILILDANTGALIWSMPSAMRSQITNSIPGGVRILDTNYNNLVDRLYFADTGGNLWRLDLRESQSGESVLTKLAILGGSGTDSRKIYNEPDVALMKLGGKTIYAVSIGTGFRAHPLDEVIQDKFFVIKDTSPFASLPTTGDDAYVPVVLSDLAVIDISSSGVSQTGSFGDVSKRGWMLNLPEVGEKVLATAVTFDGIITFTTLVPEVLSVGVGIDQCAAPRTQGRLYAFDVLTGGPGLDLNNDGSIDGSDIYTLVAKGEIPGKPQTVVNTLKVEVELDASGAPTGEKTCTHPVDIRVGKKLSQATGYEACRLESVYWTDPITD